jgi:hypothetical protein
LFNISTNFSYGCLHYILIYFISVFTDEELDAILDRSGISGGLKGRLKVLYSAATWYILVGMQENIIGSILYDHVPTGSKYCLQVEYTLKFKCR